MTNLSQEEREILESVERGEWKSVDNLSEEISNYQRYAQYQLRLNQQININISGDDLEKLQILAKSKGISCEHLIADILRKYARGVAIEV